uniref:Uncharacterized protein n=2 Tax=Schizaphis graminum TaxID=13262 RepID=A0A2S2P6V7_SCHGA
MQPMHMINNMIPTNPMQFVQKPVEMIFNTVDKFGRYGEGVKEGLTTAFRGVVGKILDQTQSGAQTVFDMGSNGTNAILNLGRRLLVPETLRKQQNPTEYGGQYYSPQQGMQPLNYAFNSQMPSPNYNGMGYNNMQPQAGTGQVTDGKNNGQMSTQHTAPQYNTEYMSQYQNMPNSGMSNPISGSQPIVRYGQP